MTLLIVHEICSTVYHVAIWAVCGYVVASLIVASRIGRK